MDVMFRFPSWTQYTWDGTLAEPCGRIRLSGDVAGALERVGVLTVYKILLTCMLCICWSE